MNEKKILIFSDAGGTGRSYHASLTAENQSRRNHYLLEPGWRADAAIQGLGRTHRTHQATAPLFRPVSTDCRGELRALLAFRQRYGRRWKAALLLRWSAGTDIDEPGAAHLRHLRNIGGPRWLLGLSAATLDDAARRFAGNVDPVLIDIFMENATGFARGASASVPCRDPGADRVTRTATFIRAHATRKGFANAIEARNGFPT